MTTTTGPNAQACLAKEVAQFMKEGRSLEAGMNSDGIGIFVDEDRR